MVFLQYQWFPLETLCGTSLITDSILCKYDCCTYFCLSFGLSFLVYWVLVSVVCFFYGHRK
jgi:hypothetical protein